jgi:LmbE family N-acetylglucosaminyl deacetylase
MNPYTQMVGEYSRLFEQGKTLPMGGFGGGFTRSVPANAPKALIFSPHPDDECIIGSLAIRLQRESGWDIKNVAVTQGSNRGRQGERLIELQAACEFMGFGLITTCPGGLEKVTPHTRSERPADWSSMVDRIASILLAERPTAIFLPHQHDWNGTHIGTHFLVMDALKAIGDSFQVHLVETEYWGQMSRPNLMVEASTEIVADQVAGISFHQGEVRRNPFHLLLPAWMQDNVRRGSELVGGQGGAAPNFGFATLYRLSRWIDGSVSEVLTKGEIVGLSSDPGRLFLN